MSDPADVCNGDKGSGLTNLHDNHSASSRCTLVFRESLGEAARVFNGQWDDQEQLDTGAGSPSRGFNQGC